MTEEQGMAAGLGGLDLSGLLEAAQGMQAHVAEAAEALAATVVEGQSGGGAVKVTVTGAWEFRTVTIAPGAVDADDPTMLEDLILAALRDAASKVAAAGAASNPMGGFDLGALGGLFGGD